MKRVLENLKDLRSTTPSETSNPTLPYFFFLSKYYPLYVHRESRNSIETCMGKNICRNKKTEVMLELKKRSLEKPVVTKLFSHLVANSSFCTSVSILF